MTHGTDHTTLGMTLGIDPTIRGMTHGTDLTTHGTDLIHALFILYILFM